MLGKASDGSLNLDDYKLTYTNSSAKLAGEINFDGYTLHGTSIRLMFDGSPQLKQFFPEFTYHFGDAGLASTGGMLRLYLKGEIVNEVCWGSVHCTDTYDRFSTREGDNMSLLRCIKDGCSRNFHFINFLPGQGGTSSGSNVEKRPVEPTCRNLEITEYQSRYEHRPDLTQFIELHNTSDKEQSISGCTLRYRDKHARLEGAALAPHAYRAFYNWGFSLISDPSADEYIELVDEAEKSVDRITQDASQPAHTSHALFIEGGKRVWRHSYKPTPNAANIYQQFQTCPEGKQINPETGRCITPPVETPKTETKCPAGKFLNPETGRCKTIEMNELKPCPAGQYRHPETHRCRKIPDESGDTIASSSGTAGASGSESKYKPCKEGYERNPETNRCRKIANADDDSELKPCKEGYERNPETNRCRKKAEHSGDEFPVKPGDPSKEAGEHKDSKTASIIIAIAVCGAAFTTIALFQYRKEIYRFIIKLCRAKKS